MRKALFMISRILFNVVAFVFGIAVLFSIVCSNATIESMITNNLFPPKDPVVVNTGKAPIRYKTWYSSENDTGYQHNRSGSAYLYAMLGYDKAKETA